MAKSIIYIERRTVVANGSGPTNAKTRVSKFIVSTFKCSWIDFEGVILEPGEKEGPANQGVMIYAGTLNLSEHSGGNRTGVFKLSNGQVPGSRYILFHEGQNVQDTEGCLLVGRSWGGSSLVDSPLWTSILTGEIRKAGVRNVSVVITNGRNPSATKGTVKPTTKGNPGFNSKTSNHPESGGKPSDTRTDVNPSTTSVGSPGKHDNHPAIIAAKYISSHVKKSKPFGQCAKYWRTGYQHAKFKFTQKESALYISPALNWAINLGSNIEYCGQKYKGFTLISLWYSLLNIS